MSYYSSKKCVVCDQPVSEKKLVTIEGGHPAHSNCAKKSPTIPAPPLSGVEMKRIGGQWVQAHPDSE